MHVPSVGRVSVARVSGVAKPSVGCLLFWFFLELWDRWRIGSLLVQTFDAIYYTSPPIGPPWHIWGPDYFLDALWDPSGDPILDSFSVHFGGHFGTHFGPFFGACWGCTRESSTTRFGYVEERSTRRFGYVEKQKHGSSKNEGGLRELRNAFETGASRS